MTIGEQLFLGLVLLAFLTFGVVLAVVSSRTNRHMRRGPAEPPTEQDQARLDRAA
jgi:hypothetical protein